MIIAEIGQNHLGKMILATELIQLAKQNGADLVKFQLYDTDSIYPPDSPFKQQAKEAELSFDQVLMLFNFGKAVGIEVFFSVFDVKRVEWCEEIGVKRYKIAYSQRNNLDLIALAISKGEVIISSDCNIMANSLYCIPHYPTDINDIDFQMMTEYDGFSDHTIGLDAAKIALARGANIIEKHFAIDHFTGVDAPWSMTPRELAELKRFENICKEVLNNYD